MSIVLDADPWENIAIAITQADHKDMRALPRAVDSQLGEDGADLQRPLQLLSTMCVCVQLKHAWQLCRAGVAHCSISASTPDPELAGCVGGRVDDEAPIRCIVVGLYRILH